MYSAIHPANWYQPPQSVLDKQSVAFSSKVIKVGYRLRVGPIGLRTALRRRAFNQSLITGISIEF